MTPNMLLLPILLPAFIAILLLLAPKGIKLLREVIAVAGAAILCYLGFALFAVKNLTLSAPWLGMGVNFDLRLFHFSSFMLLALNVFLFLIILFSTAKMKNEPRARQFYIFMFLSAAFANGAVLADNFVPFIFFWEGLLVALYGLISIGGKPTSSRTAVKAFLIGGFCDFAMMMGIGIIWALTGTTTMSQVSIEPVGPAALAFILMMIGAIGKGGSMPFHTWMPDAAVDAPVAFMAFLPTVIDKLLAIYLLARITLDFFKLTPGSGLSLLVMIVGAVTILLGGLMALIQKDVKRMFAYSSISQVGYMILGIGTAVPIGIAGGIFHVVNHAIYKTGIFLGAGSVEHRTGTTELSKLGGLRREMPLTALGFIVCGLAVSGVWPFNGFVSKELVLHGALESGNTIFAVVAWIGAIFTFAYVLKASHSIFYGERPKDLAPVKESPAPIVIPILILAALCVVFGLFNKLPLTLFIQPILDGHIPAGETLDLSTHALSLINPAAIISIVCLGLALLLHFYGFRKSGRRACLASEPVRRFPGLARIYDLAEARVFDFYEQGVKFLQGLSYVLFKGIDRPIDFIYEKIVTTAGAKFSGVLSKAHNGYYANYLAWCLAGLIMVAGIIGWLM